MFGSGPISNIVNPLSQSAVGPLMPTHEMGAAIIFFLCTVWCSVWRMSERLHCQHLFQHVNSICFLMYFMKESLNHRPIIMIAKTGTLLRYITIAGPEYIECVSTLWLLICNVSSLHAFTPSCNTFSTILLMMCSILPQLQTADMGVVADVLL